MNWFLSCELCNIKAPRKATLCAQSFFAWHIEDADLFSVNFLHWGAPKIWYSVSPSNKARFEQMAQSLHPDLHHRCKGFLRHKDVLISPTMLKQYNIPCSQVRPLLFRRVPDRVLHSVLCQLVKGLELYQDGCPKNVLI